MLIYLREPAVLATYVLLLESGTLVYLSWLVQYVLSPLNVCQSCRKCRKVSRANAHWFSNETLVMMTLSPANHEEAVAQALGFTALFTVVWLLGWTFHHLMVFETLAKWRKYSSLHFAGRWYENWLTLIGSKNAYCRGWFTLSTPCSMFFNAIKMTQSEWKKAANIFLFGFHIFLWIMSSLMINLAAGLLFATH